MAFCPVNVPLLLPPVLRMVQIRSFLGPSQKDNGDRDHDYRAALIFFSVERKSSGWISKSNGIIPNLQLLLFGLEIASRCIISSAQLETNFQFNFSAQLDRGVESLAPVESDRERKLNQGESANFCIG